MHMRANLSSCMDSRYEVYSPDILDPQRPTLVCLVCSLDNRGRSWIGCLTRGDEECVFGFGL